jgi:septum formation protein
MTQAGPDPTTEPVVLASASAVRAALLAQAGVGFAVATVRLDEEAVRHSLAAEGASPRDMADALAEMKAMRVSARHPGALVIGCDQVLALGREVFGKPADLSEARQHLMTLRGREHRLLSAVVVCRDGEPLWRHVGEARMTMRDFTDGWLDGYLTRQAEGICDTVGAYRIEEEGVRLFSRIEGDYFSILGLPLLPLLSWLTARGTIPS